VATWTTKFIEKYFKAAAKKLTPSGIIYNNVLSNTIQLFPAPPTERPNATGDLFADGILTGFIIEFNRISDNV